MSSESRIVLLEATQAALVKFPLAWNDFRSRYPVYDLIELTPDLFTKPIDNDSIRSVISGLRTDFEEFETQALEGPVRLAFGIPLRTTQQPYLLNPQDYTGGAYSLEIQSLIRTGRPDSPFRFGEAWLAAFEFALFECLRPAANVQFPFGGLVLPSYLVLDRERVTVTSFPLREAEKDLSMFVTASFSVSIRL